MRAVENDVVTLEIRLELLIDGQRRSLRGAGRFERDLQLGDVLRVEVDDPLGGAPEFLFPVNCIQRDESLDLRQTAELRLCVDLVQGAVSASIG